MHTPQKPTPAGPTGSRALISIVLLMVILSGCTASRLYNAVAPSVAVSSVTLDHMTFAEQAFTVALKVSNPNPFALPVTGIDYTVHMGGETVADGATNKSFTLPANGTRLVRLSVVGDFLDALSMFRNWRKSGSKSLEYRVTGSVKLAGVPIRLPFTYADSLSLNRQ